MNQIIEINSNNQDLLITDGLQIDKNPVAVYLMGLKESGRRSQMQALNAVAKAMGYSKRVQIQERKNASYDSPYYKEHGELATKEINVTCFDVAWQDLRHAQLTALRTKLQEKYQPRTVNKMMVAVRRVLKEAWRLDLISTDDYYKTRDTENIEVDTLPAGRDIPKGEIAALMEVCGNDLTNTGARDAAIIGVLVAAGLRRNEVAKLEVKDYDTETGKLLILHAKRGSERTTYLNNGAFDALADWLTIRGNEPGPIFLAINKGDNIQHKPITSQLIYSMIKKRIEQAGVRDLSCHDFRRTLIGNLLDAGVDISTVAQLVGHKNVNTTARYDRRPEETKRKATGLIHVPYKKRTT